MSEPPADPAGFTKYFFAAVVLRMLLAGLVMGLGAVGVAAGREIGGDWTPFGAGVLGIVLGVPIARVIRRRWDPLDRAPAAQSSFATGRDGSTTHSLHDPG